MPFETRKLLNYGTENPVVARVSFQWHEIFPWFALVHARRSAALTILIDKVQPRLLNCREISGGLKADLEAEPPAGLAEAAADPQARTLAFFDAARRALEDFAGIFVVLLGRKAPERNYAALTKWSEKWFGPQDRLTQLFTTANVDWIRTLFSAAKAPQNPDFQGGVALSHNLASVLRDMENFNAKALLFVEDTLMAALAHVPGRAAVTFAEIPEAERDPAAVVRFRAMIEGSGGRFVPAGKMSPEGVIIPESQRRLQQGLGRPIIASTLQGERFVAAGRVLLHSAKWKTFHDFLRDYIKHKDVLGGEWANLELKKPPEARHPLMNWYQDVTRYVNAHVAAGKGAPMTSLPAAYLGLAYNLYLIAHNNGKVHEMLLHRLRLADQFHGAYYEAAVAGMMIRAGFDIELEDETDNKTKHCEFTATHRASEQKFSVEAKFRVSQQHPPNVERQLLRALEKRALHPRIIFIEVNDSTTALDQQAEMLKKLLAEIRSREDEIIIDDLPAPAAYLVITNNPPATVDRPHLYAYMVEGFKMPDFRVEGTYPSLREALKARRRHVGVSTLIDSLKEHNQIPTTFDGELPAFASGSPMGRLQIGSRYRVSTPTGEVVGELKQAIVLPKEKRAYCFFIGSDGSNWMATSELSEQEMQAYHESPLTFFGREDPSAKVSTPLQLFDRLHEGYRGTSKDRLIELMTPPGQAVPEAFKSMTQEELAELYAEQVTTSIMIDSGQIAPRAQLGETLTLPNQAENK